MKKDLIISNYTFTLYNLTNPVEYLAGTEPPAFVPIGPFLKRSRSVTAVNVTYSDDGRYVKKRMGGVGTVELESPRNEDGTDKYKPDDRLYVVNKLWWDATYGEEERLLYLTFGLVLPQLYNGLVAIGETLGLPEAMVRVHWSSCALGAPVGDLNPLAKTHYPVPFEFGCWAKQRAAVDPTLDANATSLSDEAALIVLDTFGGPAKTAFTMSVVNSEYPDAAMPPPVLAAYFKLNGLPQTRLLREYVEYIVSTYGVATAKFVMGPPLGPQSTGIVLNRTLAELLWQYSDPLLGVMQLGYGPKKDQWCLGCIAGMSDNLGSSFLPGQPVEEHGGANATFLPDGYAPFNASRVNDGWGPWQHTGKGDLFSWSTLKTWQNPLKSTYFDQEATVRNIAGVELGKYEDYPNRQSFFLPDATVDTIEIDDPNNAGERIRLTRDAETVGLAHGHLAGTRHRYTDSELMACGEDGTRRGCGEPTGMYRAARGAWDMKSSRTGYETLLVPPSAQQWPSGYLKTMGDLHRADPSLAESLFMPAADPSSAAELQAKVLALYPGMNDPAKDYQVTVLQPLAFVAASDKLGITVDSTTTTTFLCGMKPSVLYPTVWNGNPGVGNHTWLPCLSEGTVLGLTPAGADMLSLSIAYMTAMASPFMIGYCIMIPLLFCMYNCCFRMNVIKRENMRLAKRSYTRGDIVVQSMEGLVSKQAIKSLEESRKLRRAARRVTILTKDGGGDYTDGQQTVASAVSTDASQAGELCPEATNDETLEKWLSRMFTNLRRQFHRAQHGGALNKDLTEEEEEEEGDFQIRIPEDRRPSIPPRSQLRRLTSTGRMLTDIGEASTTTSSAVPPPAP